MRATCGEAVWPAAALAPPVPEQLTDRDAHAAQGGLVAVFEQFAQQQPFRRTGGDVAEQLGERTLQRVGNLLQDQDRRVADPVFEIGQVTLGDRGRLRQVLARHAAPRAQGAGPLAQQREEGIAGLVAVGARLVGRVQYSA
jgi:hypothetical protein